MIPAIDNADLHELCATIDAVTCASYRRDYAALEGYLEHLHTISERAESDRVRSMDRCLSDAIDVDGLSHQSVSLNRQAAMNAMARQGLFDAQQPTVPNAFGNAQCAKK